MEGSQSDIILPDDVLRIIYEYLVEQSPEAASSALYNVAISGKRVAPLALSYLYRFPKSPGALDEIETGVTSLIDQTVMKWAILWRSLYLAARGESMYPYHTYLRLLDLRDLTNLLEQNRFERTKKYFFKGNESLGRQPTRQVVDQFGDLVVPRNPFIEVMTGSFSPQALERWIPELPRLRRLELFNGDVLVPNVQKTIWNQCPLFEELRLFQWESRAADEALGPFFQGLKPNTLTHFEALSTSGIGARTAIALNRHGSSLKTLRLYLEPDAADALGLLKGCTALEHLQLAFSGSVPVDLDVAADDLQARFKDWLSQLKNIKEIALFNIKNVHSALLPLLVEGADVLEDLTISAPNTFFFTLDTPVFMTSLIQQKRLQSLDLRGDGHDAPQQDVDGFVGAFVAPTQLRKLELRNLMDNFPEDDVVKLLRSSPRLEEVYIGGYLVTDRVLQAMTSLRQLKRITIMALSIFTRDALLALIESLDTVGNHQLQISVDMGHGDYELTEDEQNTVRQALQDKVNGYFEYQSVKGTMT